jgi:hypothetical protein
VVEEPSVKAVEGGAGKEEGDREVEGEVGHERMRARWT